MAVDFTMWRWTCPCGWWIAERDVHEEDLYATPDGPVSRRTGYCSRCGDVENVTFRPIRWVDDGQPEEI